MSLRIKVCYKCFFEFTELAVTNNMASSGTNLVSDILKKMSKGVKDTHMQELKVLLSSNLHPPKVAAASRYLLKIGQDYMKFKNGLGI